MGTLQPRLGDFEPSCEDLTRLIQSVNKCGRSGILRLVFCWIQKSNYFPWQHLFKKALYGNISVECGLTLFMKIHTWA